MEVTVENTGSLARRMTVQVPATKVDQEVATRLQSLSKTVRMDGFRTGKVPMKVVEKKFGRQVREEVIGQVVNSTLQDALAQKNLRPVSAPAIEPRNITPGEPLEYVADFEIFPELTAEIQFNFPVSRPVVEISDQDVDGMLENLRRQRATWSVANRASAKGDRVVIDFEGKVDGQSFSGNKASNMPLVLGSGSMIKGFEENLEGLSAGESRTISVTFPENYPSQEVAGKAAEFVVQMKEVSDMVLPEMNDEFVASFGITSGGLPALKEDVTGNMRRELKGLVSSRTKEQIFNGLLESNPVDVPGSLIENELRQLAENEQFKSRGPDALRKLAERRVRLGILISELAKRNKIQIDPNRVREMIETIASSYETPAEVVQWYYGNQEMLMGVQSSVIEEQVAEWVMEHGGVEVTDRKMSFNELVEEARRTQG